VDHTLVDHTLVVSPWVCKWNEASVAPLPRASGVPLPEVLVALLAVVLALVLALVLVALLAVVLAVVLVEASVAPLRQVLVVPYQLQWVLLLALAQTSDPDLLVLMEQMSSVLVVAPPA
jgi:hypothetical protein